MTTAKTKTCTVARSVACLVGVKPAQVKRIDQRVQKTEEKTEEKRLDTGEPYRVGEAQYRPAHRTRTRSI
jgi:hypothetical protein